MLLLVLGEDDKTLFRLAKPPKEKPEEDATVEETVFFHNDADGNLVKTTLTVKLLPGDPRSRDLRTTQGGTDRRQPAPNGSEQQLGSNP